MTVKQTTANYTSRGAGRVSERQGGDADGPRDGGEGEKAGKEGRKEPTEWTVGAAAGS